MSSPAPPHSSSSSILSSLPSVLALSVAGGSIYLIPYFRYTFYDLQQQTMGVTHTEIALLTTAYALGCLCVYVPGGILSDRTRARRNIVLSLVATTALTVLYAFTATSYALSLIIWFAFALSTAFVFWGSLFKVLRLIAPSRNKGLLFGVYYAGNGLTTAVVNSVALAASGESETRQAQFLTAVLIYAASTLIGAIVVMLFVPRALPAETESRENHFVKETVGGLLRSKSLWLFAIVIFIGYGIYSSMSYFTPYFSEVVGVEPREAGLLTTLRYALYIFAPISGLIADRVFKSTSKWFVVLFGILAVMILGVLLIPEGTPVALISAYSFLPALFSIAIYGVQFSIASEARIPPAAMATAVGIASMIGYAPDFFLPASFGSLIDGLGEDGYTIVFLILAGLAVVGAACSYAIRRRSLAATPEQEADTTVATERGYV